MLTYGLVKQVGPYARNNPQTYQQSNMEIIQPRYPYNPTIGLGTKSRYAQRVVEDREGVANPKLRKVRAEQKNKEIRLQMDLSNLFGRRFMVMNEVDGTLPVTQPAPVVEQPDPTLSLKEMLSQAVQFANVLLGQQQEMEELRTPDLTEESVQTEVATEDMGVGTETATEDMGVGTETATEERSVGPDMGVGTTERGMQTELDTLRRMDKEVMGLLVSQDVEKEKMIEKIDMAYDKIPNTPDVVKSLIDTRREDLQNELYEVTRRVSDIKEALMAAKSSSINPQVRKKSLLNQSLQIETGTQVPEPRIQPNSPFTRQLLGKRLSAFETLYGNRFDFEAKSRKKRRRIEDIGDEEPLYNEPQYQRELEIMNETVPLGVLQQRYQKEKRKKSTDSGYSTSERKT
jgi:hypothetical protein